MRNYDKLVIALQELKKEGYTYDFNLHTNCLHCPELKKDFSPADFEVEEIIHFEGDDSSPDSRSILYLIATGSGEKGVLLQAGGIYNEGPTRELLAKLQVR
jgi:hypothetical protein